MIKTILPSTIQGSINANPSKSAMQRAVAAALLATGKSTITNPGFSDDCLAALDVAEKLGAKINQSEQKVEIESRGIHPASHEINCGEAGLGIRMFTPIAALCDQSITITGRGSLVSRPMDFFETVLPQLGIRCHTQGGTIPINIQGPLQAKDISIDGSLSSQFLTGLLMAYGAVAENTTIRVDNLKSRQYIELTIQIMDHFGVKVLQHNFETFSFGEKQSYHAADYTVEGDWSGAAFMLVAGAITGSVQVKHLLRESAQPDKAIMKALEDCGASIKWNDKNDLIVSCDQLASFEFDATDCPDLFPPLVALAANCSGTSVIKGVSRLQHKESHRGLTLQQEFNKTGIQIELQNDIMKVKGGKINSAKVTSHHDHRIAMACAIAALNASGEVEIAAAEAVNKSYPEFWDHLQQVGGKMKSPENQSQLP
jgi:3-phosphoshikimate 1-carboxyvinyltransferase